MSLISTKSSARLLLVFLAFFPWSYIQYWAAAGDAVKCEGRPVGHSTCMIYQDRGSCETEGHCIWMYPGCQVFDECMTNRNENSCLEDAFCEWSFGACFVARTGTGEVGGCILIEDKDTCADQTGCTWIGSKNILLPILVIVILVAILVIGVCFAIWYCRTRRARLVTEQDQASTGANTPDKKRIEITEVEL